ncbi:MAG TPA: lipid II flippase MurJ [Patescibacteria group bacterium]|nr:lipid II flippase MurJ [Patescibacteria group bacterium]
MNWFFKRANKKIGLGNAAALLIVVSLIGQVLGFLRYKMVNANFLAVGSQSTDAYFAAFKIPDFFFFTLAAGALGVAFMPILAEHLERGDRKGVWELSNSLLNLMAMVMFVVGLIILIFARPLLHFVVAPNLGSNLPPDQQAELVNHAVFIMRLIAFNPLFFAISGILTSVQQTFGRFFFYAIGPIFYNFSIIVSVLIFRHNLGLVGLGVGAMIGGLLQLLVAALGLFDTNFHWRPKILWSSNDFKTILRQLPPRSIDQGVDSINSIVETNLATRLGVGNISFYENAYIMHTTPTLVIGTTIATAAFPRMTERLAQGRTDLFRKDFLRILRTIIWITIPVVVICFFARGYFARLIFAKNAKDIALIFGYLTGAIFFRTIYAIISRWFYAQKDTKTPLFVSLFAIGLNIFLAYNLSRPQPDGYGIAGLALAQSIVAASEVLILGSLMYLRDRQLFNIEFWSNILQIVSVTGFSVVATYIMLHFLPLGINDRGFITLGSKLGAISLVTLTVHVFMSWLFGLEEAQVVIDKAKRFILRPVRIDYSE